MKSFVVVVIFCINLLSLTSAQNEEKYSRRYDNIDVDLIFRTRLLSNFVDCLLDKKPCSPEGKDLKNVLPDALRTRCSSCTKIQKAKALDAITRLYYQHPEKYLALAARYDPTGEYTRNFENWFDEQNAVKPTRKEGNQFITRATTKEPQEVRRQPIPNRITTERTRIPSTWITTTSRLITTTRATTTRPTLRTLPSTVRSIESIFRETPSTTRFVPTTQAPIFRTTTRAQTFRETQATSRVFAAPVTQRSVTIARDPVAREVPRSSPVEPDAPVVIQREVPTTLRFIPTTQSPTTSTFRDIPRTFSPDPVTPQSSTFIPEPKRGLQLPIQPPSNQPQVPTIVRKEIETIFRQTTTQTPVTFARTQPPAIFKEIQTILRAPEVPVAIPAAERIPQPAVVQPATNFQTVTQPTVQTRPSTEAATSRNPPTTLRAPPLPVQTIPPTFRPQTQSSVPRETSPSFAAPENERTQPRFGDSEPKTREIFSDPQPNRPRQQSFQPIDLIDNFFVPNGNQPFRRSINQLWSTTGKVVNNVRGMVRSTIGVIAGAR